MSIAGRRRRQRRKCFCRRRPAAPCSRPPGRRTASRSSSPRKTAPRARGTRNRDIWIVRPGQKPQPLLASPADERGGVVSPDGHWLAYASSIVRAAKKSTCARSPAPGARCPVSNEGGTLPHWSRAGDALFYLATGPRMMRASFSGSPPQVGVPAVSFSLPPTFGGMDARGRRPVPDGDRRRATPRRARSSTSSSTGATALR